MISRKASRRLLCPTINRTIRFARLQIPSEKQAWVVVHRPGKNTPSEGTRIKSLAVHRCVSVLMSAKARNRESRQQSIARYGTGFFENYQKYCGRTEFGNKQSNKIGPRRSGFEFIIILELGTVRSNPCRLNSTSFSDLVVFACSTHTGVERETMGENCELRFLRLNEMGSFGIS